MTKNEHFPRGGTSVLQKASMPDAHSAVPAETTEGEIASLFDRWNRALQSGDPQRVVANYANRSILLPTMSGRARLTPSEKLEYFREIMEAQPAGEVTLRQITINGTMAVDTGHYTFRFAKTGQEVAARYSFTYRWDGQQWLIVSHHSSPLPDP